MKLIILISTLLGLLISKYLYFFQHEDYNHSLELKLNQDYFASQDSISLFFVGDLMGHESMINAAKSPDGKSYNYEAWFKYLSPEMTGYDLKMLNLEVTLGGSPFSGYPMFSSPDSYAVAAKKAGFNFFITANNHSLDRGKKGLERTLIQLDSLQIDHTGTFRNEKERSELYPFVKNIKNKKLIILNYTYGTNGLKEEEPNIVNRIDTNQIKKDFMKSKELNSDFTIVTIHWGAEYQRNFSTDQKKLAQWLCDNGADAIIGMHPHVVQPMEILHPKYDTRKNVPVAYSLGNFISGQRDRYKDGGIGLGIALKIVDNKVVFSSWEYLPLWVRAGGNPKGFYVIPGNIWRKNPSSFNLNVNEQQQLKQFLLDTRELLSEWPEKK